jgi:tetratricopeptide (TPR) repeat protein
MRFSRRSGNDDPQDEPNSDGWNHKLHDFYLDLGVQAERSGELLAALELYEKAVKNEPESALAWYNLGDTLLSLKRYEKAVEALEVAVGLSPQTGLYHYDLGMALYALDRHEEARREFAFIADGDPKLQRASSGLVLQSITNLALSLEHLGYLDDAVKTLVPARQTAVNIIYNLAWLNFRAKRPTDALPLAQAAATISPKSEPDVHLVGRILMDLKREPEALEFLRRAIRLDPCCTDALYDLGVTLARLKQRREARTCFNKVVRQDPDYFWGYYDLACLDALENKPGAAFKNLNRAVAHGFEDVAYLLRDQDLRSLWRDPRWTRLLAALTR